MKYVYDTKLKIAGNIITLTKYKNPIGKGFGSPNENGRKGTDEELLKIIAENDLDGYLNHVDSDDSVFEKLATFHEKVHTKKVQKQQTQQNRASKVIDYINTNTDMTKFITLTMADNITDIDVANHYFMLFIKRLNTFLRNEHPDLFNDSQIQFAYLNEDEYQQKRKQGFFPYRAVSTNELEDYFNETFHNRFYYTWEQRRILKYLAVIEFQKRGAIHFHVVSDLPFINANLLALIWKGFNYSKVEDKKYDRLKKTTKKTIDSEFEKLSKKNRNDKRNGVSINIDGADYLLYFYNKQKCIWKYSLSDSIAGYLKVNRVEHVDNMGKYVVKYMTKDNDDSKLNGKKAYLRSDNLRKPAVLTIPTRVQREIAKLNLTEDKIAKQYKGTIISTDNEYETITYNLNENFKNSKGIMPNKKVKSTKVTDNKINSKNDTNLKGFLDSL